MLFGVGLGSYVLLWPWLIGFLPIQWDTYSEQKLAASLKDSDCAFVYPYHPLSKGGREILKVINESKVRRIIARNGVPMLFLSGSAEQLHWSVRRL